MAQAIENDARPGNVWLEAARSEAAPAAGRRRRPRRLGLFVALGWLVFVVLVGFLAPVIAPYDPIKQDLENQIAGPSLQHIFGTDDLGRDVLARLMYGARPAIVGVVVAIATACIIGLPWGLIAGYAGGLADLILMRLADAILVLPGLVIAIGITTALGQSLNNAMLAVGIVFSPVLARVMRSGVLTVRDREYVMVTRMYGLPAWHRMLTHVLPNAVAPAVVQITLLAGVTLLVQSGLGFLGVGLQPPSASWGDSLNTGYKVITVDPAAVLAPGVLIVLSVVAIYRIGDFVRERLEIPT